MAKERHRIAVGPKSRLALAFITSFSLCLVCAGGVAAAGPKAEIKELFKPTAPRVTAAQCSAGETQRFREQTTGTTGKRALKVCEREAHIPEDQAKSVVSHIAVRGWTATVHLRLYGNDLEGQILEIRLIRIGARWKADEILGFFHLDRDRIIEAFKEEFTRPGAGVPPKVAACIYGRLRHATEEEMTEYLFGGTSRDLDGLYGPCLPGSVNDR